jgi:hypothetical protein
MGIGGSHIIQKDGQAMNTECTGSLDVLNPKHAIKRRESIGFSYAMPLHCTLYRPQDYIIYPSTSFFAYDSTT